MHYLRNSAKIAVLHIFPISPLTFTAIIEDWL